MIHADEHDPILGDEWALGCAECLAARNSTFAQLRKLSLGPHQTPEFILKMQAMAREHLRRVST